VRLGENMNTTTLLEQGIGACAPMMKPEWLRIPDAIRVSGIGRSTLYQLISSGSIKSVLIRKRGCQRGIRLISADSLRAYIQSFATEGGSNEQAA
jgi:hypothetical protein